MSDTQIEIQLVKTKDLKTDLESLLKSYTKNQLNELSQHLHAETKKSWRKDKLIQVLQENVIDQATTIYAEILEEVFSHLPDTDSQVYRLEKLDDIEAFAPLIQKGFFFVSKEGDSYLFIIPDEVKEIWEKTTPPVSSEITDETSEKGNILKEWKDKQVAIFGSYSVEHLTSVWNRYYDDNLTEKEVADLL